METNKSTEHRKENQSQFMLSIFTGTVYLSLKVKVIFRTR